MKKIILYFFVFVTTLGIAQESESKEETSNSRHSIGILLGHSYLSEGHVDGKTEWLTLPSIALDYNYSFSEKWSLGLHNDIVIENFKIENYEDEVVERSRPLASILTAGYKPGKHFTFQAGLGGEFAKEENLFVTRIGIEYSVELPSEWEFLVNLIHDNKWTTYDSFGLSVGVCKKFGN